MARPRIYPTNAARQKAYRERLKRQRVTQPTPSVTKDPTPVTEADALARFLKGT